VSAHSHASKRVAVIVTGAERQARLACVQAGFEPVIMLSRDDCASDLLGLRRRVARSDVTAVVIHTADWRRQSLQPFFEMAAALIPARQRLVLVGDGRDIELLSSHGLWLGLATLPVATTSSTWRVLREMRRFHSTVSGAPPSIDLLDLDRGGVLAVWRGDPGTITGGAVTHAAGMLGALRRRGFRVGLVTMCAPPPQLAASVDDVEIAEPLPRSARVTREVEDICLNRVMIEAGERLMQRLSPAFLYQRYDSFMTCGMQLSSRHRLPLVLEWNSSAAWVRRHWGTRHGVKHMFDRFLVAVEERSLQRSVMVRAVSPRAAEMAIEYGAPADRVFAISNAVDIAAIPPPGPPTNHRQSPLIGWVGSFGPWHGAPVLIEALAQLPMARAVLVGEGAQRDVCIAQARKLGVDDRIEWTGMIPHHEAIARLHDCDILVSPHVPSKDRPFFGSPTKMFEFMAIGRPLVASALEQIDEVLENGRTARLVRPGDVDDLVRGVRDVLQSPDRGRAMGLAARSEAEAHHTWDYRAAELIERLQSLRRSSGR
jgi:glycosyltransferase involved in cell wall biosynthesis